MKKLIFIIIVFIPLVVHAYSAECYVVMDYDSGRVLLSLNPNREKLIASTTKIMSAIIAIENSDLESVREVGMEVVKAYGSAIYLSVGEKISLRDLLYGLMLRSGNDAAIEIAYHVAGSMEKFVSLMNRKAYQLGMSNTHFINNHGLEENGQGNISSAYDMALLMRYAINNDIFKRIINTKEYVSHTSMKKYTWVNKNKLLYSYKYMIGGKTGFTKKAGRTLVTVSEKNKKRVIVVTLNDGNDFKDHESLANYVFNNYGRIMLLNHSNFNISGKEGTYYIKNDLYALLNDKEKDNIKEKVELYNNLGDDVGFISMYLNDNYLVGTKIYKYNHLMGDNPIKRFIRWVFKW